MCFEDRLVLVRGGGDLATGVVYRLRKAGFPVIVLELAEPRVVRRRVALASAVDEGRVTVEELTGQLVESPESALELSASQVVPVLVSPSLPTWPVEYDGPAPAPADYGRLMSRYGCPATVLVDARMAKRNIDTARDQAPLVVALGPGFEAGRDCHAVVETKRGHRLGRAIWSGPALPDTGTPGIVAGKAAERVLRAPAAGPVSWRLAIGDLVREGEPLGDVAGEPLLAPFDGVLRGLIKSGFQASKGQKIGDLDARADVSACFTISDKALAVAGGVLEAILTGLCSRG
jgi:xanthine dehydrogenase accessory factor